MQKSAECLVKSMNDIFNAGIKGTAASARRLMADDLIKDAGLEREAVVWAIQNDMTKGLSEPFIDSVIDNPEVPEDVREKWLNEIKGNKMPYEAKTGQHARAHNFLKGAVTKVKPCPTKA